MGVQPANRNTGGGERHYFWPVGDLVIATAFIIFAVLMFLGALDFNWMTSMGIVTSAAFTPIMLSILILILSVVLIGQTLRQYGYRSIVGWAKHLTADEEMQRSFVLAVITGVYIALVGTINFILANALFLFVMYWYLHIGSLFRIVLYTLVNAAIVGYLVPRIFQMPIPG